MKTTQEIQAYYFCSSLVEGADPMMQILIEHLGVLELQKFLLENRQEDLKFNENWLSDKGYTHAGSMMSKAWQRWKPRVEYFKEHQSTYQHYEEKYDCDFVYPGHTKWPAVFDDLIFDAPISVWMRGDIKEKAVSLVGCRAATDYGKTCAFKLARGLALQDYSIVSGGAYGIDASAHLGAIHHDSHTTVVFANGFGQLYPKGNIELFKHILNKGGCWMSETHPEFSATKWRFLQRNRLIAALSKMVVVVEANIRSGAKNTVNHAYELQRPVGIVPGSINSPQSQGCFEILKENNESFCITSSSDILEVVEPISVKAPEESQQLSYWSNSDELRVLDALPQQDKADIPTLAIKSGLSTNSVKFALKNLEKNSHVMCCEGSWSKKEEVLPQ